MSTVEANHSNIAEFLSKSLSIFKKHIDYTENFSVEFKELFELGQNLRSDYAQLIKSNETRKESPPSHLAKTTVPMVMETNTIDLIKQECVEEIRDSLDEASVKAPNTRKSYSVAKKVEVINRYYEEFDQNASALSQATGISQSIISKWIKDKGKLQFHSTTGERRFKKLYTEGKQRSNHQTIKEIQSTNHSPQNSIKDEPIANSHTMWDAQFASNSTSEPVAKTEPLDVSGQFILLEDGSVEQPDNDSHFESDNEEPIDVAANRHGMYKYGKTNPKFKCDLCNIVFNYKSSLDYHLRKHRNKKELSVYNCTICSKGFNHPSHLAIHMRVHSGDKPFKCTVCTKEFNQSNNLTMHMRLHTGEKPFKCSFCGKGCTASNALKIHMRSHTKEKPYTCEICKKGFSTSGTLKKHISVHDGKVSSLLMAWEDLPSEEVYDEGDS